MTDQKPKTTAERQREWRQRRRDEGYEMHTVWLDPDVAELLAGATGGHRAPQGERQRIINDALRKHFRKPKRR